MVEPHISHEGEILSEEATFVISAESSKLFQVTGAVEAIIMSHGMLLCFQYGLPSAHQEYTYITRKDEKPHKQVRRVIANWLNK